MKERKIQAWTLTACLLVAIGKSDAAQRPLLIGGGYELAGSQGQIELNLGWVQQLLNEAGQSPTVFYTDGDDPAPDVFLYQPVSDQDGVSHKLARVFGEFEADGETFRNHRLEGVSGTTQRDVLEPQLRDYFASMQAGDELLVVYNGHGAPSVGREDEVSLKLWGDTRLSAGEFQDILDESLDPAVPLRYVFTQCYSGGFHRLIYENSESGLGLAEPLRCGFTAESPWRQSEGCSASIDMGDYRDYTTFFFAALNGEDRLGEPLKSDPDLNGDGQTDLLEAHLYTLEHAHSTDLSRSSSEVFLENRIPYYMSWVSFPGHLPDNRYGQLTQRLAARLDVPLESMNRVVRERLRELHSRYAQLRSEQLSTREEAQRLRRVVSGALLKDYPKLAAPYTAGYRELLAGQGSEIQARLDADADYRALVEAQDAEAVFDRRLLDIERDIAQLDKLKRLRRLAFYLDWLNDKADADVRQGYERLVGCESVPLSRTN
ncbi:hypothetical protein Q4485_05410 [Granulosicoccaceae sp. 1_MG-2023]|nr:hypothetical protein [Granulosicoccaceae sp. 1_MG-2023]